ncbi:MAG: PAS domain-containing protein, partial [Desulfocapsaceae bacterium]|nr:PAS domain-containing protein [Desulfocapsaceae bacterium]
MTTKSTVQIDEYLLNSPSALTDLGDNIVIIDKEHRIIFQNRLCQKIYGAKIGEKCHEEFRNQDTICPDCPSQRVFLGEGIIKTEHFYTDNNNGEQWLELIASPLTNKEGETIATIIVRRDVTEIKKKAAEKDLLIQQLYKAIDETKTLSGFLPICIFCK